MALKVNEVSQIYLGIQGENGCREITIDVSDWLVAHPQGSVSIWHKRNGDATPSATGAVFDDEEGTITWTPSEVDTYVSGEGEAEIRLTENNVIKKSRAIRTGVSPAVTGSGEPLGSDWQSYIDEVDRIKSMAVAAKQNAEAAAENAEAFAAGTRDGEPVEDGDPAYENNAAYYRNGAAQAKTDAEKAREDILGMTVVANKLPEGSDPTASYEDGVMTFGLVTGDHAALVSETEKYQQSISGTVVPTGEWLDEKPVLVQGQFLWIQRKRIWNGGQVIYSYEAYYTPSDGDAGITIDSEPTEGSQGVPRSGGTYTMIQTKVSKETGKGLSTNDYTDAEKTKLDGIEAGAEVNPGNATQAAAGLMSAADKTKLDGIVNATQSQEGLMSAADKTKLDGIETGAEVNPGDATQAAAGLMSAADKTKLDGIETGAEVNPGNATQAAAGLMSATDKKTVDGIPDIEESIAIVIDGDEAPAGIAEGSYLFIKNHSTLPNGGYHATAAIASGDPVSLSNVAADSDGIANSLNEQMANIAKYKSYAGNFSVTMETWVSPLFYADISVQLPNAITNMNQLYAMSHSNQFWVVDVSGTNGSKNITMRIASLSQNVSSAHITVFYVDE